MNHQSIAGCILALVTSLPALAVSEGEDADRGRKLFERYGCTTCHGQYGVHPTSKYVPVLKGKSATYIFENASASFRGERNNGKARLMHEQFCAKQGPSAGCDPAPTSEELMVIAKWLESGVSLPTKKRTPQGLYVTSKEAYERIQKLGDKALFLDIRTRAEVTFLGMPTVAHANIPYMMVGTFDEWDDKKQTFKLQVNSGFVLMVEDLMKARGLRKDSPIFLMCRSGNRSAKAASVLYKAGYKNVYNVTDGYEGDKAAEGPRKGERVVNGWRNSGLPWSYRLNKTAMYWEM